MKTLIVYYSYSGNTKEIAELIHKKIGGYIIRIETVIPYEGNYNKVVAQGQDEVNRDYCPEIKHLNVDLKDYDTIVIGTPVWWYTFAPAIHTFLNQHNFNGKKVYPFATNGGWIGHTFKDFNRACKGADIQEGMNIRFDQLTLCTKKIDIKNWIDKIK